jgi:hypothetical protein
MSEMAYVPLMAFFAAVAWMIWRGYSAKQRYLRRKAEGGQKEPNIRRLLEILDVDGINQVGRQQFK